jgi:hypothetical protein
VSVNPLILLQNRKTGRIAVQHIKGSVECCAHHIPPEFAERLIDVPAHCIAAATSDPSQALKTLRNAAILCAPFEFAVALRECPDRRCLYL